jgi:outer membrane protein assembly factor BamE (lipoprotein component of BamABCDE complex)
MKSILYASFVIVLAACIAGCASTVNDSKFTADTITQIKTGMTKSDVTAIVGEPRSRSVDNAGDEVWQYRKNAQEGKAVKTFADITSFGLTSGIDAEYQDILTVMFKTNVVSKATYEENVHTSNVLNG